MSQGPILIAMVRTTFVILSLVAFYFAGASGIEPSHAQNGTAPSETNLCAIARQSGTPQVAGLTIVYLTPLGDPRNAPQWRNIILHQMEGPAGSAKSAAAAQAKNPTKRGTTLWVETNGIVYWSVPETAIPTHGDGANRKDNKYIDNTGTYRQVLGSNSLGIEFAGNFPDVRKPATPEQREALTRLLPFLQERYRIPAERIYAHNWIDYKDARYCEGCELGELARKLDYKLGCR